MIILGIDPGTATIGYGVLNSQPGTKKLKIACLAYGLIETTPEDSFPSRLKKIDREYARLLKKYQPGLIAIESVFFFRNLKTFIPVSRASGVLILGAARKNIPIMEFTPLQVKSLVANYGRADKKDLQRKIKRALGLNKIPEPDDIADALAVALCAAYSQNRSGYQQLGL